MLFDFGSGALPPAEGDVARILAAVQNAYSGALIVATPGTPAAGAAAWAGAGAGAGRGAGAGAAAALVGAGAGAGAGAGTALTS